ncbi:prostaglandin E receptor 2b subtype EP2 isoform X1 [Pleuronectes platessa]|uniref:prostaglandin E receptor 2b subtype EP2 isoform X1 n=1 Tax=Pleuronectes platessa TaxID=8262 RepID=UPI00232A1490|nr:prostaglandin E receptor 2b subtype EP2 isoform X1 [Pleuronectes platessa]
MSVGNNSKGNNECQDIDFVNSGQPYISAVMFSAGVFGNIVALLLLKVRRGRTNRSLYQILVTALLLTDLLGSLSVSPAVLAAYFHNKTLVAMSSNKEVCSYFGFSMTFLSLSTLGILCVIALERYFSIGHPYMYEQHLSTRCAYVVITLVYTGSILFCIPPFMGFGDYVQYCPGTWCFLQMAHTERNDTVYTVFYASLILIMSSTTVVCNVSVIYLLVRMHGRGKVRRLFRHHRSMTEEVAHLLPLAFITVVFICCTFPLVLRVYINLTGNPDKHYTDDLQALRLLSFHSIINPWVFIILRPSALKIIWKKLQKPQKSKHVAGGHALQLKKQENEDNIGHG